jgi:hypothetical protein
MDVHPNKFLMLMGHFCYHKKMPSHTYIWTEDETTYGFSDAKDHLTFLFWGNVANIRLKPALAYHSENPRALEGYIKAQLPVFWQFNKKACMTASQVPE